MIIEAGCMPLIQVWRRTISYWRTQTG